MATLSEPLSDEKQLDLLLVKHTDSKTSLLDAFVEILLPDYETDSCLHKISNALYNVKEHRVTFYKSPFEKILKDRSVNVDVMDNRKMINKVTHADDLPFWDRTLLDMYKIILTLSPEELKAFSLIGSRRMLEKDDKYGNYIHEITPLIFNETNSLKYLRITTKRVGVTTLPQFRIYRNCPDLYSESHAFSQHLLQLKLKPRQIELLEHYCEGKTDDEIATLMDIKLKSVRRYMRRIKTDMKVNCMKAAAELWCILKY
jgi:DNA-binding CsgD family transcriptional regulator